MKEIKNILKPDPHAIVQNIYAAVIIGVFSLLVSAIINFIIHIKHLDLFNWFYSGVQNMNAPEIVKLIIGYGVPVIGIAVVIFVILFLSKIALEKILKKITNKNTVTEKKIRTKKKFDKSKAAFKICELAEKFRDDFEYIRYNPTTEDERSKMEAGQDLWLLRKQKALDSFCQLRDYFKPIRHQFDCRKQVEENFQKLANNYQSYSNTIDLWVSCKASPMYLGNPLLGLVDKIFGNNATKSIDDVKNIVEIITQLLTPYIRGEK